MEEEEEEDVNQIFGGVAKSNDNFSDQPIVTGSDACGTIMGAWH